MRWILLGICFLAGCDSPGIGYSSAEVTRVSVGENSFSLRRSGYVVQAIRTNFLRRPDILIVGQGAEQAIEQTYGCTVTKMRGDVALMLAQLDCTRTPKAGEWARWVSPKRSQVSCLGNVFAGTSGARQDFDVTCF